MSVKYDIGIKELEGKKIKKITGLKKGSEEVSIQTECNKTYVFYHDRDCCELVDLEDFDGDADDLIGALITTAEAPCSKDYCSPSGESENRDDCIQWTFYKIETNKGGIFMRWLGSSNGYYSVDVGIKVIDHNQP